MKSKAENLIVLKGFCDIDHAATAKKARELREGRGVFMVDVAPLMNISGPYLSDLETGRRNWSPELAVKFLDALERKAAK